MEDTSHVNSPTHYNQYSVEVINFLRELPFDLGNVGKYVLRAPFKGKHKEDLRKAMNYLNDYEAHPIPFTVSTEVKDLFETIAGEMPNHTANTIRSIFEGNIGAAREHVTSSMEEL